MSQNINLLHLLYADNADISAYKERKFANEYIIKANYKCVNNYNHIKQSSRQYLMFDIDKIQLDKINLLFNNDFFTPNFYIYDYSKNKQCYTLQVFLLLDHKFNPDKIKDTYKKLCLLFGADTQYQIKTGIHKNPAYYELININELDIKIPSKNHIGYIHNRRYNLQDSVDNLEYFGYLDNLANVDYIDDHDNFFTAFDSLDNEIQTDITNETSQKITVKVKAVSEVKKSGKKKSNKEIGTRNSTLFEKTRLIAYGMSDQSLDVILHIANKVNSEFINPLKDNEVKKVAKSIYSFITNKFGKTKSDPFSTNQRAKSIEVRKNEAIYKIKMAIISLQRTSKNITFSAIKTKTKQNINTIKNNFSAAMKQAEECNKKVAQKQIKEEKRAKKEYRDLCKKIFNKPIRTRSKKRSTRSVEPDKLMGVKYHSEIIPDDLMLNFDTSCDFIFNNGR